MDMIVIQITRFFFKIILSLQQNHKLLLTYKIENKCNANV